MKQLFRLRAKRMYAFDCDILFNRKICRICGNCLCLQNEERFYLFLHHERHCKCLSKPYEYTHNTFLKSVTFVSSIVIMTLLWSIALFVWFFRFSCFQQFLGFGSRSPGPVLQSSVSSFLHFPTVGIDISSRCDFYCNLAFIHKNMRSAYVSLSGPWPNTAAQ